MKVSFIRVSLAIIALMCAASAVTADTKVKTKTTVSGQSFEGITYIKKSRQRSEQNLGAMSMATITQCDLRRTIQINDRSRKYLIMPFGNADSTGGPAAAIKPEAPKAGAARRGGVITMVYAVTDTGERKQMFGLTARHLKVVMTTESSPDACNPSKMKMEMDGWYVDLDYGLDCEWGKGGGYSMGSGKPDCVDEYRMKTTGTGKLGYPLSQTMITYGEDGREMSRMTTEIVEFSQATLDPALFEIPAGYTEAKSMQELYMGAISPSIRKEDVKAADATVSETTTAPTTGATGSTAATKVPGLTDSAAPKKAGAVRIGLVMTRAQMKDGVPEMVAAEGVRNTFAGYINGPTVEVVALNARQTDQAIEEARQKSCDYVLFSSLTQKKGGGMFGKIASGVAGAAGSAIPYGDSAGEAAARAAATTAIHTTATIAGSVKAKDEVTLEYKLLLIDSTAAPLVDRKEKAKAKSDGEDVVTPMVEQAANSVVRAIKK